MIGDAWSLPMVLLALASQAMVPLIGLCTSAVRQWSRDRLNTRDLRRHYEIQQFFVPGQHLAGSRF
jgi:hypothetical protein